MHLWHLCIPSTVIFGQIYLINKANVKQPCNVRSTLAHFFVFVNFAQLLSFLCVLYFCIFVYGFVDFPQLVV